MTERMSKWHRRGERQKETTDTYRDGWDRIFAKPADMSHREGRLKRYVVTEMLIHSYTDEGLDYDTAYDRARDDVFEMIQKGEL